jgi:hypothetical protein
MTCTGPRAKTARGASGAFPTMFSPVQSSAALSKSSHIPQHQTGTLQGFGQKPTSLGPAELSPAAPLHELLHVRIAGNHVVCNSLQDLVLQ